jgi:outer membrane protein assembly factor BamB
MADLRRALEERRNDFAPAPGGYERLVRRRERRARYRRIEGAALALAVLAVGAVAVARVVAGLGTGPTPGNGTIDASNVGRLRLAWTATLDGPRIPVAPAVANGVVYASSMTSVEAFPASCGNERTCRPDWVGTTGVTTSGQGPSAPVVANGLVFVASDRLYAFPVGCGTGGAACAPLWTSKEHGWPFSNVAVADGVVYVGADRLYAFSEQCPRSRCFARWVSVQRDFQPPAAGDGLVFASSGVVLAYRADCAASPCSPAWQGTAGTLAPPALSGSGTRGSVLVTWGDTLYAFPVACRPGADARCAPEWTATPEPGGELGPPIVGGRLVYVGGTRLYAFTEGCASGGEACSPTWKGPLQSGPAGTQSWAGSAPAVANDVVFASTDRLYAFRARCETSVCRPLWVGPATPEGFGLSTPAVAGNTVFAVSAQGALYAYALSPSA